MAITHYYWGMKATPAMLALAGNPWGKLIGILEGTPDVYDVDGVTLLQAGTSPYLQGLNDFSYDTFQIRHNLNVPFDAVIYEAAFDDSRLSLEIIRQKLVAAFNLADNRVTVTTSTVRLLTRTSIIGAFKLDGNIMFRATLFGRSTDSQAVTWDQSRLECIAFLAANSLEWDGV